VIYSRLSFALPPPILPRSLLFLSKPDEAEAKLAIHTISPSTPAFLIIIIISLKGRRKAKLVTASTWDAGRQPQVSSPPTLTPSLCKKKWSDHSRRRPSRSRASAQSRSIPIPPRKYILGMPVPCTD